MPDKANKVVVEYWLKFQPEIELLLQNSFLEYVKGNQRDSASDQHAASLASQLHSLFLSYVQDNPQATQIESAAAGMAEGGPAIVTATHLMKALGQVSWLESLEPGVKLSTVQVLNSFHLYFLEQLAQLHVRRELEELETAHSTRKQSIQSQFDSQQAASQAQELHILRLNQLLQLNAKLAGVGVTGELLEQAAEGIRGALKLEDVSVYELVNTGARFRICVSTASNHLENQSTEALSAELLERALLEDGEVTRQKGNHTGDYREAAIALKTSEVTLGAMLFGWQSSGDSDDEELLTQVRTFAQSLAAMWQGVSMFTETQHRAHELEILHGRYVDRIWSEVAAEFVAENGEMGHEVKHEVSDAAFDSPDLEIPVRIGNRLIGSVLLPPLSESDIEDLEFVHSLGREMGNALNTARLLQTTSSYSNQLSLAAEVSQAATTILDLDVLIQEVVELIQTRFDFYYVGLFLVDDKKEYAVLRAGTGEPGRLQLNSGHRHAVGGESMIGAAIANARAHVEQDVSDAVAFAYNPNLPQTRSELALPLRLRGEVVGALTVQSEKTGAFAEGTVIVLQSLADQLAITIANATMFAQLQDNLSQTDRLFHASRAISEATNEQDVYEALVEYAKMSERVDVANVMVADRRSSNYVLSPVLWSRHGGRFDPSSKFRRDRFAFGKQLVNRRLILIDDSAVDSEIDPMTRRLYKMMKVRSSALIPIHVEDEWLGTIGLHRSVVNPFTEEELQPFLSLADQAAIILANQQLLRQTESSYRIGRSLSQTHTPAAALDIVVREIAHYTGAAQCRIILYDQLEDCGKIAAEYRTSGPERDFLMPRSGDFVYEQFVKHRKPLLIEAADSRIPAEVKRRYLGSFETELTLLIPAESQKELIGYLALDPHPGGTSFSPNQITFAHTTIDQLAVQLENLKLLEQAISRAQELITLNQVQSRVSGILELGTLADIVYRQLGQLLDNTFFVLALFEANTNVIDPVLCMYGGKRLHAKSRELGAQEPLSAFLQKGETISGEHSYPIGDEISSAILDEPLRSSIWVPLRHEGRSIGLIGIRSHSVHAYSENDVQLLRSIATQTTLAIANAQLFEEIQTSNEQLRQLDTLKTQFLANMSHELRTPLNSIIGFSRVILKGIDGPITDAQEEDLTTIFKNGHHLLALINEILDMAKIGAGKMALVFESVDVKSIAGDAFSTIRSLVDEDEVKLIWEISSEVTHIEADPLRIKQILMNLLSNAAKYTEKGSITLKIGLEEDQVHFIVQDTGIGIAEGDFGKLFAAFEQVDNATTRTAGGTGLGLPITKWLVETHHGQIWLESEVNKGATFHVMLPLRQPDSAVERAN